MPRPTTPGPTPGADLAGVRRGPGRPRESDGLATQRLVLDHARQAFAELGYLGTTYRILERRTGLSTPTLYHYYPSKPKLYAAVVHDNSDRTFATYLEPALASCATLADQIDAYLDAVQQMSADDTSLAALSLNLRLEGVRIPELAEVGSWNAARRRKLFEGMADLGVRTGELRRADRQHFVDLMDVLSAGLTVCASSDEEHRSAITAVRRLARGQLVKPVSPRRVR